MLQYSRGPITGRIRLMATHPSAERGSRFQSRAWHAEMIERVKDKIVIRARRR
jgi:hypothetical protein